MEAIPESYDQMCFFFQQTVDFERHFSYKVYVNLNIFPDKCMCIYFNVYRYFAEQEIYFSYNIQYPVYPDHTTY